MDGYEAAEADRWRIKLLLSETKGGGYDSL